MAQIKTELEFVSKRLNCGTNVTYEKEGGATKSRQKPMAAVVIEVDLIDVSCLVDQHWRSHLESNMNFSSKY